VFVTKKWMFSVILARRKALMKLEVVAGQIAWRERWRRHGAMRNGPSRKARDGRCPRSGRVSGMSLKENFWYNATSETSFARRGNSRDPLQVYGTLPNSERRHSSLGYLIFESYESQPPIAVWSLVLTIVRAQPRDKLP